METVLVPGCRGFWSAVALANRALPTPSALSYCCTLDRGLASEFSFLASLQRSEADALRLRWHMNLWTLPIPTTIFVWVTLTVSAKLEDSYSTKTLLTYSLGSLSSWYDDSSNHREACGTREVGGSEVSYYLNSRPLIHLCSSSSPDISLKDIFKMKIRAISLIPKTHCSRAKVKVQVAF